jgi:hypothetical protein
MERNWIPVVERLQQILDSPWAVLIFMLLVLAVAGMLVAIGLRGYRLLLLMLLVGQMFNIAGGATQGVMTLIRFGAVFALAVLGLPGVLAMGATQYALLFSACYMLVFSATSIMPLWSFQNSVASLMLSVGISGVVARYARDYDVVRRLLRVVVIAGVVWIVLGTVAGGHLRAGEAGAGRYTGLGTRTGAAAEVAGLITPFLLWGFLHSWKRGYRYLSLAGLLIALPMLVLMGQRIGLFSAIVGMTPLLLLKLNLRRALLGIGILVGGVIGSVVAFRSVSPALQAFLMDKYVYRIGHLSGREDRWHLILGMCLEEPFLGRGAGTAEIQSAIRFGSGAHQSYLCVWHDGGVIAIGILLSVIVVSVLQCFRLLVSPAPPEVKEMGRLILGCLLALSAEACFESSLASPTNLNVGLLVLCVSLVDRLGKLQRAQVYEHAAAQEPALSYRIAY